MPTRSRLRTLEALGALTLSVVMLRSLSFPLVARFAGRVERGRQEEGPLISTSDPVAAAVGRSIHRAAARLPWNSTCLVRALAGRLMLKRRGVPSSLVLGVSTEAGELKAHAWLIAGHGAVCGGEEAPGFHPIAVFRAERP